MTSTTQTTATTTTATTTTATTTTARPSAATRCAATILGAGALLAGLWSVELPAAAELVDHLAGGLRLLASALLGYLLVAATLNLVLAALFRPGSRRPRPGFASAVARCTPRWLAAATLGAVVGSGAVTPGLVAARSAVDLNGAPGPHDDVVLEVVEPDPSGADGPRTMLPWAGAQGPAGTPTTRLPPPPQLDTAPDTAGRAASRDDARREPEAEAAPPRLATPPPTPAPAPLEHVVQPGEHFWSIAEQVVGQRGANTNSSADADADVESYWRALVAANRDRLVDPDDTDLLHPGQVLVLP